MEAEATYVSLNFVCRDADATAQKENEIYGRQSAPYRIPLASSLISGVNPGHLFCGGTVRVVAPSDRTSSLPLGETEEQEKEEESEGERRDCRLFASVLLETWKQPNKHVFGVGG